MTTQALAEAPPMRRFRRKMEGKPEIFRQGRLLVVTEPNAARTALAFRPEVFEETALLGVTTRHTRDERQSIKNFTNRIARNGFDVTG